jgi:predicted DNA-binding transcriptional regulator AlpA
MTIRAERGASMAITYIQSPAPAAKPRRARSALPPVDLTKPGRLRVDDVLTILRVSRTAFWTGIKTGRFPPADFHEGRIPYWKTSSILPLVEGGK